MSMREEEYLKNSDRMYRFLKQYRKKQRMLLLL